LFLLCSCSYSTLAPLEGGEVDANREEADIVDAGEVGASDEQTSEERQSQVCIALQATELELTEPEKEKILERCKMHRYFPVMCRGNTYRFTLQNISGALVLGRLDYPDATSDEPYLGFLSAGSGTDGWLDFSPPRSGEYRLQVLSIEPEREASYRLALECPNCSSECSRYPLVLVHGWTGFASIGPIDYFYGVPDRLRSAGYEVYTPELDPYNSTTIRSEQLAARAGEILAGARARKLNFIAHSQGGLDSRRLISTLGFADRTAALVTLATPHRGTPLADIALGKLPGPAQEALDFLLNLVGAAAGHESDALASFASLTTEYLENEFNPENPDEPGVSYLSWTGFTCPLGFSCGDVCDVEIRWSYDLIYLSAGDNDGIVPVSSAPWGEYRGTIPADHFDEVGQVMGVTGTNFDHLEFYLELARELARRGF
jgi:triacylglycerol esterase/lipase EstA (alpha/beta hydrolase family)